ncbi:MAG TPA: L-2-amino-thiazoline-4-carboxylic acid hydrolase [Gemmataceae bacterium]|nr:L-2-amino-thiazoline-4-carboxylic acid hydrolase [Gemmataceae bacterium]
MPEQPHTSLLKQREIEARIVGPIYRAFAKEIGEERARAIIAGVIRELAHESGCDAARRVGGNDIAHFAQAKERWQQDDALTIQTLRQDEQHLNFNVTRCRYAEMYMALGLPELGGVLSCGRDGAMGEGFNPELKLRRTQTIMEGASHCDFRYTLEQKKSVSEGAPDPGPGAV